MYTTGVTVGGRYRLIQQIGEGGMASVWHAEHTTLGSPVAVKFLHSVGPEAARMTDRFLREARVAASVRHRNVVEIKDFGLTDDGIPYMVMEYLEGMSLAERLSVPPRPTDSELVRLFALTLRGLAAVHDAGIVHRDLKPENVFLVSDADGVFPKLLDFGVSRQVDSVNTSLTQEGMLVGTPDYMSPEQARGLRDIDKRSDIYSAAVILYECLTGRLPFESENVGDLIVMITTHVPRTVAEWRPDLPPALSEFIAKGMARNRDERFQDAREMRWALLSAARELRTDAWDGITGVSGLHEIISDMPPPPDGPLPHKPSGSWPLIRVPTPEPAKVPSGTFQTAPTLPAPVAEGAGSGTFAGVPSTPPKAGRRTALVAVAVAGIAAVAGAVAFGPEALGILDGVGASPPDEYELMSNDLPMALLDAGTHDAGDHVVVRFEGVPDGGVLRIQKVPVGREAVLPRIDEGNESYSMELVTGGRTVWRQTHPASVDGEYLVWVEDGEGERVQERTTKRRRGRGRNRRLRRR